jgi:hypothetical protein
MPAAKRQHRDSFALRNAEVASKRHPKFLLEPAFRPTQRCRLDRSISMLLPRRR